MSITLNHTNDKDESLFNRLKFDDNAFEAVFKKHFLPLCAFCQYKSGFDPDATKEVVHTAFIKLWETRPSLARDLPAKACLYKIINNNSLDILRHEAVQRKHKSYVLQGRPKPRSTAAM